MRPLLRAAGHDIWTPSYTGLGERAHLANPAIDLDTHIKDVVGVLEMEDLNDVVLIGHSYGGMVATGVADRARERIAQLVYLDAFVPRDGQSVLDLQPPEARSRMRELAQTKGDGWRIPPNPMPPDTPEADVAWASSRRFPQPVKTFETAVAPDVAGGSRRRAPTSTASATRRAMCSASSPSAREREGWRLLRDGFEPQSAHHPARGAARDPDGNCVRVRALIKSVGSVAGKKSKREEPTWTSASSVSATWASTWRAA